MKLLWCFLGAISSDVFMSWPKCSPGIHFKNCSLQRQLTKCILGARAFLVDRFGTRLCQSGWQIFLLKKHQQETSRPRNEAKNKLFFKLCVLRLQTRCLSPEEARLLEARLATSPSPPPSPELLGHFWAEDFAVQLCFCVMRHLQLQEPETRLLDAIGMTKTPATQ